MRIRRTTLTSPTPRSNTCCAAGGRARSSRPATTSRCRMFACATCRPTSATGAAAPNGTAIPFSFSRWAMHHTLNQQQLNEIGRVDIVFVPVDGSFTLDQDGMLEVVEALKAPLMIPMHFFSSFTLQRFLARAGEEFKVETKDTPSLVVSKTTLPSAPTVVVLPGR